MLTSLCSSSCHPVEYILYFTVDKKIEKVDLLQGLRETRGDGLLAEDLLVRIVMVVMMMMMVIIMIMKTCWSKYGHDNHDGDTDGLLAEDWLVKRVMATLAVMRMMRMIMTMMMVIMNHDDDFDDDHGNGHTNYTTLHYISPHYIGVIQFKEPQRCLRIFEGNLNFLQSCH